MPLTRLPGPGVSIILATLASLAPLASLAILDKPCKMSGKVGEVPTVLTRMAEMVESCHPGNPLHVRHVSSEVAAPAPTLDHVSAISTLPGLTFVLQMSGNWGALFDIFPEMTEMGHPMDPDILDPSCGFLRIPVGFLSLRRGK